MNGQEFLEAFSWGSLFLLIWTLLFERLPLNTGTILALVFFLIVSVLSTGARSYADKEAEYPKKERED